jgi:catechol 2,3-dioxygenase-like lactoylglutathione lyase family enzyme
MNGSLFETRYAEAIRPEKAASGRLHDGVASRLGVAQPSADTIVQLSRSSSSGVIDALHVCHPSHAEELKEKNVSITQVRSETAAAIATVPSVNMKLEVVVIPVSDVDRAKRFYGNLGWRLDAEFAKGDVFRVLQFTPPGSSCSIHFGKGITSAVPGSAPGLYLVVSDIEAARTELVDRGVDVSQVFHRAVGEGAQSGPDPARRTYSSYATFNDPDGNVWLLQEVTARLPGRVDADETTFTSSRELASALRRAAAAHGEHEKRTGGHDANWPDWYAEYIVAEHGGNQLPS